MFGFLIGALSLYGLIRVLRYGRGYGACGARRFGGGWGHHGHHGWHGRGGWDRGGWDRGEGVEQGFERRPGFWLRGLFSRLDTTPGQEKVIRQSVDEVMKSTETLRGELDASRRDIAQALRTGTVDATAMGELFARHDEKLREVRTTFVGALAKVSDALDEDQKKRLADMIDRGGAGFAFGGPYRGI